MYLKIDAVLTFAASSDRGVRNRSKIMALVLPHRFVGEVRVRIGEISQLSCVHACKTHNGMATSAPGGSTIYFRKVLRRSLSSAAPSTGSCAGTTDQCVGSICPVAAIASRRAAILPSRVL